MNGDDLDLNRPDDDPLTLPPDRSRRTMWIVVGAFVAAVLAGAGIRWWTQDRQTEDTAATAPPAATEPAAPEEPVVELPPLDQMDAYLRVLLGTLSTSPELTAWLATDGLLQQLAVGIDRVAQGASPARDLKVLAPKEPVSTTGSGRTRTIDPASYQRYDGIANTVDALDPSDVARAYRTIKPQIGRAHV